MEKFKEKFTNYLEAELNYSDKTIESYNIEINKFIEFCVSDIIAQIESGATKTKGKYEIIVDRKEAIKKAIKMMNKKDIVIIAGKGHEIYQEINGEKIPFDEREIVKEILGEKK